MPTLQEIITALRAADPKANPVAPLLADLADAIGQRLDGQSAAIAAVKRETEMLGKTPSDGSKLGDGKDLPPGTRERLEQIEKRQRDADDRERAATRREIETTLAAALGREGVDATLARHFAGRLADRDRQLLRSGPEGVQYVAPSGEVVALDHYIKGVLATPEGKPYLPVKRVPSVPNLGHGGPGAVLQTSAGTVHVTSEDIASGQFSPDLKPYQVAPTDD
jgi:hypothetical protein